MFVTYNLLDLGENVIKQSDIWMDFTQLPITNTVHCLDVFFHEAKCY